MTPWSVRVSTKYNRETDMVEFRVLGHEPDPKVPLVVLTENGWVPDEGQVSFSVYSECYKLDAPKFPKLVGHK